MASTQQTLDSLLPLMTPRRREVHLHAAVLEVADPTVLAELASNAKIRRCLIGRLSDTAALVEARSVKQLQDALLAAGHTPKIEKTV